MTTGDFQNWSKEIESYILDEENNTRPSQFADIATVIPTDDLYMIDKNAAGLGAMQEVSDLGNAVDDSAIEGYQTRYELKNFRKKVVMSRNLMKGDKVGLVEQMAREVVRVPLYSRELNVMSVLRNAWDATKLGGDGKPLISTTHPRKDGGTAQANTYTDGVQRPITYDNVLRLQDVGYSMVSHTGNVLNAFTSGKKKLLFGAPSLREKLYQIAGPRTSDVMRLKPGTDENDINYIEQRENFDVLVLDALQFEYAKQAGETGSATKTSGNYWDSIWGLIDVEQAKKVFKVFVANGYPYNHTETNWDNESITKYIFDAYMYGFSHYNWIVASKGDGSTYSS